MITLKLSPKTLPLFNIFLNLFSYQRSKTQDLLDTILSIQPKESSSGGGETREASVYRQSKEMLDKVPPNFDPHEVKEKLVF